MATKNQKDLEFEAAVTERASEAVEQLDVNSKMKASFLNYAMSVIIARALPDARDGLKPVQRRILYGMNELKVFPTVQHKKSARIVGDVMGKYHPHGDSSIYEAMVHMAQDFSYRYTLVDGHGNFGNIDGDGAAAMRYTEARLSKIAMEMLRDIDKDTVDFVDNYDATEQEPALLPARIPNLLVNGTTGIAVGMATNIPPHNLNEVLDGCIALLNNPELTSIDLMQYIKAPDFPTGGIIMGRAGLEQAYTQGRGSIVIRSKAHIEELDNGKKEIIVTEIPYGLRKTQILEEVAKGVKDKIFDGITDLRDESSMAGIKIVIELRKDVNEHVMLNTLFKRTSLQTSYGMNMVCLVDNRPVAINLHDALDVYLKHQVNVLTRRTEYNLKKAKDRIHILDGLLIARDNIDEVVHLIRDTKDGSEKERLMERFNLSDVQAQAILDMRLQRLSGLNYEKTIEENKELLEQCKLYEEILGSYDKKREVLISEMEEIKAKYGDARHSELALDQAISIDNEDLIEKENVIITVTNVGYMKRMSEEEFRAQRRGGTGSRGIKTHEDDQVSMILPCFSHDYLLMFTNKGRVYEVKTYMIPEGTKQGKGTAVKNIIPLQDDEKLQAICSVTDYDAEKYLFFITRRGICKRTKLSAFKNIRSNGIIAIGINVDDELENVYETDGNATIILGASNGKTIHFNENDVRAIGRQGAGVKGMELGANDYIVGSAVSTSEEDEILVITNKGYGKRTKISEYRLQTRGGLGVKALNQTDKNGLLTGLAVVTDDNDLIVQTAKGTVLRTHVAQIALSGRATQGVIIVKIKDNDYIASIAITARENDEENEEENIVSEGEVVESTEKPVEEKEA